jgi:hypothetical protein
MKVAVVGSRDFRDRDRLFAELDALQGKHGGFLAIVSGGAKGADTFAEEYAKERNLVMYIIEPDWATYGRGAGVVRNAEIVKQADLVVAFWDGESRGTRSTIKLAEKREKPVVVVRYSSGPGGGA